MEVRFRGCVEEFRALAEPLYRRDPVAHTVELTLLEAGDIPADSLLMTIRHGADTVGAVIRTPPYPLMCNAIPDAAVDIVVAELIRIDLELDAVRGARDTAVAFADAWRAATGRPWLVTVQERLYRLGTLRAPSGVAGIHRFATEHDRDVLIDWVELFFGETFGHPRDDAAGARFVDAAEGNGDRFVLWVVDGAPVSMALVRAPAAAVSRLGPVFTPSDRRGNGFGSAVTAAAADVARRDSVRDVVLFTDLANPVSNSIYQRIGFEAVADSARIEFVTADTHARG